MANLIYVKQKLKDLANEINPFNSQRATHFIHDSIRSAFPSHMNNEIVFFAGRDGNQNYQIYRIRNLYDVDIEAITKNHKAQHEWGTECYSHDERYIRIPCIIIPKQLYDHQFINLMSFLCFHIRRYPKNHCFSSHSPVSRSTSLMTFTIKK